MNVRNMSAEGYAKYTAVKAQGELRRLAAKMEHATTLGRETAQVLEEAIVRIESLLVEYT